jgi:hypothetical protein
VSHKKGKEKAMLSDYIAIKHEEWDKRFKACMDSVSEMPLAFAVAILDSVKGHVIQQVNMNVQLQLGKAQRLKQLEEERKSLESLTEGVK